jgi:hypothetical protein
MTESRVIERKEFLATIDATLSVAEVQAAVRQRLALPPLSTLLA